MHLFTIKRRQKRGDEVDDFSLIIMSLWPNIYQMYGYVGQIKILSNFER